MKVHRCGACGTQICSSEGITGGRLTMLCPNRECETRKKNAKKKPVYQKIDFDRKEKR
jgi:hypothetical protein